MLRLSAFLLFLAVVNGFKLGQDTPYQRAFGGGGAAFHRGNQFSTGSYPQGVAYSARERYTGLFETITPLRGNFYTTNWRLAANNNDPWLENVATVVGAAPGAPVKEGDLVYIAPGTAAAAPVQACVGVRINLPNAVSTRRCSAIRNAAGVIATPGITDRWCQLRSCSALYADKCAWSGPALNAAGVADDTSAPYCANPTILGTVRVRSYGANRNTPDRSRIVKPGWAVRSVRSEPLNQDYPNGL